jgi:hypothetical protein
LNTKGARGKSGALGVFKDNSNRARLFFRRTSAPNLALGNFSQGGDDFSVVGYKQRLRSLEKLFRSFRSEPDEFEAVRDLIQAIFYSNTRHTEILHFKNEKGKAKAFPFPRVEDSRRLAGQFTLMAICFGFASSALGT